MTNSTKTMCVYDFINAAEIVPSLRDWSIKNCGAENDYPDEEGVVFPGGIYASKWHDAWSINWSNQFDSFDSIPSLGKFVWEELVDMYSPDVREWVLTDGAWGKPGPSASEVAEDACNAAVRSIQYALGRPTGDFASKYFSGGEEEVDWQRMRSVLYDYAVAEMADIKINAEIEAAEACEVEAICHIPFCGCPKTHPPTVRC